MEAIELLRSDHYYIGRFRAMANPCEILIDTNDQALAAHITALSHREALRIEHKYSRYRNDSVVHAINTAGHALSVDGETADLLDYAAHCYHLSDGLFDITCGALRSAWQFSGESRVPDQSRIETIMLGIGWNKVQWQRPVITLGQGMEIDLGGIAKEYAVDKTVLLIINDNKTPCLINFGGDIAVTGARSGGRPWLIGIETASRTGAPVIELHQGAVATSGDTHKHFVQDNIRYSHILNPKTGRPVRNAPRSVTVSGPTCSEAGLLATLAMLHGECAEEFLHRQSVKFWCDRNG